MTKCSPIFKILYSLSIVLYSPFDMDASGGDGSLEPNTTYDDFQWILVRDNGGTWEVKTYGYG